MLEIKDLSVTTKDQSPLLQNVSFHLIRGQILGLTGQSGAGKSTVLKALMGILSTGCYISNGEINIDGSSLVGLSHQKHQALCGTTLAFIPQNPMTAFDNRIHIGKQMRETFMLRLKMTKKEADKIAVQMLDEVNLSNTERILKSYSCELSGGMLQRVTVAILLAMNPRYLLADEPTSALDEDNSKLLIDILKKQKNVGILFVSHDIDALTELCDEVMVMEHGQITECAPMHILCANPKQEWTCRLTEASKRRDRGDWIWTKLK